MATAVTSCTTVVAGETTAFAARARQRFDMLLSQWTQAQLAAESEKLANDAIYSLHQQMQTLRATEAAKLQQLTQMQAVETARLEQLYKARYSEAEKINQIRKIQSIEAERLAHLARMQSAEAERQKKMNQLTNHAAASLGTVELFQKAVSSSRAALEHESRINPAIHALLYHSDVQTTFQQTKGSAPSHQPHIVQKQPQSLPVKQFLINGKVVSKLEYEEWAISNHYRTIGQKGNYARGAVKRQIIADFIRENREFGTSKNQFAAKYHKRYNRTYATIRNILKKVTV